MAAAANGVNTYAIPIPNFLPQDARRAREFYRYLQPDNLTHPNLRRRSSTFDGQHDHVPSLSSALAPYCQLAALRCNATKAMLNVMDRDIMYFLAEASMERNDMGEKEFVYDPILMSCSKIPLSGRICELTLRLDTPEDISHIPTFVIPDLTKSQFADMEIVTDTPFYRFYAGVPLTTRKGVNIGSLAIMDTVVRPNGLSPREEEFLGNTAQQIMTYLETNRQAIEGRRSRQMAEGLEAFISGKSSLIETGLSTFPDRPPKRKVKAANGIVPDSNHHDESDHDVSPSGRRPRGLNERSSSIVSVESDMSDSVQSTDQEEQHTKDKESDSRSHSKTFARAANLLRECMGDLGDEGSVQFMTFATRLSGNSQSSNAINASSGNLPDVAPIVGTPADGLHQLPRVKLRSKVVARSTTFTPNRNDVEEPGQISALDDETLRGLMRRHPGGYLWSLEESAASSSEDDSRLASDRSRSQTTGSLHRSARRKRTELAALRAAFPGARQVLFVPVWDATIGAFAYGCFITTSLETRSFGPATELPFLNSFCSTVMAECSRLDTMVADRQKSDFVGTISHEMRSPLHGILASVEFLAETEISSFQKSLIDTIDSCGRTLLDTINHVLDFSKVNSFQKQWQAANNKGNHTSRRTNNYLGPKNSSKSLSYGAPPLLQLFGLTDVSTVLEEVVDGLVLGHTYNSGIDITDTSREARGRTKNYMNGHLMSTTTDPVQIVLNVQKGDWMFMTQPGAVRRIIMNITGNAIKYTTKGTIHVSLQQRSSIGDGTESSTMVLTVTDTGKGISPEFLASRLFVPFAQENALAPGTGLGMSIVRSIVLMLGGTIDVKSQIGQGTTVEVALPMKRPLPGQVSSQNTPHSGGTGASGVSSGDDSILLLQNQAPGETVSFYRQTVMPEDKLSDAVQHYIQDWYNLEYSDRLLLESASVIVVEEEDLEHLIKRATSAPGRRPALVVMCSVSARHSPSLITSLENRLAGPVEFVAKPCGPNKLARSICSVLEKKRIINSRFPQVALLGTIPEAATPGSGLNASTACDGAGVELQEMDLSGPGEPAQIVQATETFAASSMSQNAQMAIRDPSAALRTPRSQMSDLDSFPFPEQGEESPKLQREAPRTRNVSFENPKADRPEISLPQISNGTKHASLDVLQQLSNGVSPISAALIESATSTDPRVLLVDDNKINLRLLETFLTKKRKYTRISKAEDGQQAVNAVMKCNGQFDIIFMDISMPVMNGFEATRTIRAYEEQQGIQPGAMVIALTGLASGRDQSEGFDSGCDIYMTKPVSFKEVGRLLDNWEGHHIANALPVQLEEKLADLSIKKD